jgi:hypothetical protein
MHIDKRPPIGVSASIILALCAGNAAHADDAFNTAISGYGSIGGTYTGDSAYTYILNGSQFKATNSQFDLGTDSRIGLQATFTYGTDLSVIVQEEAKRRGSDNFSLGTEWAFLQYKPTDDLKLRLGRVALATFLMSDFREVGYAQTWFHAPNEVYSSEPFETLDGAQALWHVNLGPVGLDLEGEYGTTSEAIQVNGDLLNVSAKSAYNVAAAISYKDFLLRIAETVVSFPETLPLGPTTVVNYLDHDKFLSVGFQYDNGTAIVLTEWAKRSENAVPIVNLPLAAFSSWYVAGGWRFGKLTPMVTYAGEKWNESLSNSAVSYTTPSISLRYDLVTNVALKAQFSRPQADNASYWTDRNPNSGERVNVFSLGADFVF